jgi:Peptidase of plants and bacteria
MRASIRFVLTALLCLPAVASAAPDLKPADTRVAAVIETTLATAPGQIRQFALDGDADSYFASKEDAASTDHFTLVLDKAVAVKSIAVTTGKPKGGDLLDAGVLEVSADGKKFEELAKFADGAVRTKPDGKQVKAIRIRPTSDLKHPLAIREIALESEPAVSVFKHPVEVFVNVSDAPEMKEWAEKAARICEQQFPLICEDLKSDGFKPRHEIRMTLSKDYNGVAATGGGRITGSVKYFKAHADDFGAMVHETVHVVQSYGGRGNPGWLVEGIADYERFFKYEPGKIGPLNPNRARYDGSYRVTAAFLAYVTEKHDKDLVRKLNAAMREGKYTEELFKTLTGKSVKELDEDWRASLKK